jgi:hypothetical protein
VVLVETVSDTEAGGIDGASHRIAVGVTMALMVFLMI